VKFIKSFVATLLVTAAVSAPAHADFFHTDWKAKGDQLAVVDTDTGLEWLKIDATLGRSYNDIVASLNDEFSGWRLPTNDEVTDMFNNMLGSPYGSQGVVSSHINSGIAEEKRAIFREYMSIENSSMYARVYGWFENGGGSTVLGGGGLWDSKFFTHHTYSSSQADTGRANTGVYLVSDGGTTYSSINNPSLNNIGWDGVSGAPASVSAPFAAVMGLLGLAGLMRRRKV
tara:strand:- start:8641 stop:9327 length:687 start_codon:yes stop_codon:yes gene_type:complete